VWEQLAGPLSSVTMGLRSLRSRHAGGTPDARELDRLIGELDHAFGAVMRAPYPPVAPPTPSVDERAPRSIETDRSAAP
jgi:hypothetical protein